MSQTDPFDLLTAPNSLQGAVKELSTQVQTLSRRNVSALNLGDLAPSMGQVNIANTLGTITENGFNLNGGYMNVSFWASIGVPSNVVTYIFATAFIGNDLYVGGNFTKIGGINANNIAKYNLATGVWSNVGSPNAIGAGVFALAVIGTDLYVGGEFINADGNANADRIAKWNGSAWSALGTGFSLPINALAVSGTDLYAVGNPAYMSKWSAGAWSTVGGATPFNSAAYAIAISGSNIYVGGLFTDCNGVANADYIAKWDGSTWSALGAASMNNIVYAIAINGTDVYAGGAFTNCDGNANADYIAKWDGAAWSALGVSSLNSYVKAISINGTDVYVCGNFTDCDGIANADYITKWSGSAWAALDSGLNAICNTMTFFGNDLYCGGQFTTAGGKNSKCIAAFLQTLESVLAYLEISSQALQDGFINRTNHEVTPPEGWNAVSDTWAYASASTITIPSDGTLTYQKGMKVRLKQGGGYKYYTVASLTATVITVFVNTDYTVANAAITDIAYSYADLPFGWPEWFTFAPIVTGFSVVPTSTMYRYCTKGKMVNFHFINGAMGTSNATTFTFSLPVAAATVTNGIWVQPISYAQDNTASITGAFALVASAGTVVTLYKAGFGAWTNVGAKGADGSIIYEF